MHREIVKMMTRAIRRGAVWNHHLITFTAGFKIERERNMPRIPLLQAESLTGEHKRVHDLVKARSHDNRVGPPYHLTLHHPELLEKWQQVGLLLRYRTSLSPRLSELAILVAARFWDCQYEWLAHEPHAIKGGLPPAIIEAIRAGKRPEFEEPDDEMIYEYVRELQETHFVNDANYQRVLDRFGIVGVIELTALIGEYTTIAMTLNAHRYELPPGVPLPLPQLDRGADSKRRR